VLRILMLASLLLVGASILIEVSAEQWYETLLELITCSVFVFLFVFVLFISSEFLSRSVWLFIGLLFIIISSLLSVALELEKLGSYIGVSTTNAIAVIDALYVCGLCLSTYGLHRVVSYYITHSYYDELTGLCNRRRLNQFEIHIEDDCLIYIDLDGLKSINDQSGHDAGDDLIVEFANLLKSVPDVAECFRVGGRRVYRYL